MMTFLNIVNISKYRKKVERELTYSDGEGKVVKGRRQGVGGVGGRGTVVIVLYFCIMPVSYSQNELPVF